jgi:hypothetical protein
MPEPVRLSARGLTILFAVIIALTVTALVITTLMLGRASDKPLPVSVIVERRLLPATIAGQAGQVLTPIIAVTNLSDQAIPRFALDINGQYFLYRDAPLDPQEEIVVLQDQFFTKSNQRFVPGRWPITKVTAYGQLPSGARGVYEYHPAEPSSAENP